MDSIPSDAEHELLIFRSRGRILGPYRPIQNRHGYGFGLFLAETKAIAERKFGDPSTAVNFEITSASVTFISPDIIRLISSSMAYSHRDKTYPELNAYGWDRDMLHNLAYWNMREEEDRGSRPLQAPAMPRLSVQEMSWSAGLCRRFHPF